MELVWGLAIPFIGTTLGSAMVFLMKNKMNKGLEKNVNISVNWLKKPFVPRNVGCRRNFLIEQENSIMGEVREGIRL